MDAGMHVRHESVEMGPAFFGDGHFLEKEVHQHGLAAADIAPDVKTFWLGLGFAEQRETALPGECPRQLAKLANGIALGGVGFQLALGQGLIEKPHAYNPARARMRAAMSASSASSMRRSKVITPLPGWAAKASSTRLA